MIIFTILEGNQVMSCGMNVDSILLKNKIQPLHIHYSVMKII